MKTETQPASKMSGLFTKLDNSQSPKKNIVSVKFSHVLFCLLDFLMPEIGPVSCPETLVRNYHSMMHIITQEYRSHMII
jgi:hypothetical protein